MTREEKIDVIRKYIDVIRKYSADLTELAVEYAKCAAIADRLPDSVIDVMVVTSIEGNRIHADIADTVETT